IIAHLDDPESAVLIEGHRDGALDLWLGGDQFDAQARRDTEGGTGLFGCQRTARRIGLLWRTIVALTLRVRKPPTAEGEGYDLGGPEDCNDGKAEEQRQGGHRWREKRVRIRVSPLLEESPVAHLTSTDQRRHRLLSFPEVGGVAIFPGHSK